MRNSRIIVGCLAAAALTMLAGQAQSRAHPSFASAFATKYPTSTLPARMQSVTGSSCNVCHTPGNTSADGSCYKTDLAAQISAGANITQAINNIALFDSDGDGVSNQIEILMARTDLPGQTGYHPGLKGPTGTGPCNTNTTAAVTNQLETPPAATCYPNCDGSAATPLLTANDFQCFLNKYASNDPYANCDASTASPLLTANDFQCFLNKYAAGCT